MRFSQDFIEKVRESTNIVDIISQQTQLKRAGVHRLVGLCPFHNEKTPSFSVSEDKQTYFCFGCKKGGNVYHFIQETQGLSFPETVEFLAQKAGIAIPKEEQYQKEAPEVRDAKKERQKLLFRINHFTVQYFQAMLKALPADHSVWDYIRKRGLSSETIEKFQIGFAPEEWEALTSIFHKKKVPLDAAESLGLIRRRTEGKSGHYDIFRGRLIFPIHSQTGQVLGFGGRILGEGQPKYLNSPESEIFHKGRMVYGLHESAKHIRLEDQVVIVEGYMDYLALEQAGIKYGVATLGTALTPDHARLLKRLTKNIILLFDGDNAGQEAAKRSLPILLHEGLVVRGLILPDQLDPDEFIQKYGAAELQKKIKLAPEVFSLLLNQALKDYRGTNAEKISLFDQFVEYLVACSDRRLKELYIRELADRMGVETGWIYRGLQALKANEPNRTGTVSTSQEDQKSLRPDSMERPEKIEKIKVVKPPRAELYLLNLALMREKFFHLIKARELDKKWVNEGIRQVWGLMEQLSGQLPNKFDSLTAMVIHHVEPQEVVSLHLQPILSNLSAEGAQQLFEDCARKQSEAFLKAQAKVIRANLKGQDKQEQLEKLEQIMNIHRNRHSLKKEN